MANTKNPTITVELASPTNEEPTPPATTHSKVVEQITIPVRPALVAAANVVATTTAAAATSGPAALAIAAGTVLTGAALTRSHQNERRRRNQEQTARQIRRLAGLSRGGGHGLSGLGLGGFGKTKQVGRGKPRRLTGTGFRKHRTALGGLGAALRRVTSPQRRARTGAPHGISTIRRGTRPQHHPLRLGGSRTPHGPLSRLRGHPAVQTAHRAIRRTVPVARTLGKATLMGIGGLGWLLQHLYKALCWLSWKLRRLLKPHENDPKPKKRNIRHVGDSVNDPDRGSENGAQKTADQPAVPKPERTPAMSGTSGLNPSDHQGTSPFFAVVKTACDELAGLQYKGNMAIRAEAYDLPACLAMLADAIGYRADAYRKESLDPDFVLLYAKAQEALHAVAQQMMPLGSYFDALHPERVRDLLNGNNPAAWDTTNNQTIG